ncbi:MAG: hypothetical protein OJF52_002731 [Nitrospira sp.]|nr:MAG: hypothetical protein OJF52_002731 [Nitrospira sp.]
MAEVLIGGDVKPTRRAGSSSKLCQLQESGLGKLKDLDRLLAGDAGKVIQKLIKG